MNNSTEPFCSGCTYWRDCRDENGKKTHPDYDGFCWLLRSMTLNTKGCEFKNIDYWDYLFRKKETGITKMKTLDEVIDWYENRKGILIGLASKDEMEKSILSYLKQYRGFLKCLEETIANTLNLQERQNKLYGAMGENSSRICEQAPKDVPANPVLTYEQLIEMVGQPVWVELLNDDNKWYGEWCLIEDAGYCLIGILRCEQGRYGLRKISLGKRWRAYKKEQK